MTTCRFFAPRRPLARPLLWSLFCSLASVALAATPVITSPAAVDVYYTFVRGGAFTSYQIVATNSPTAYDVTPVPQGASISRSSGLLFISAEQIPAGIHALTISASNADGTATQPLAVRVHPSPRSFNIALASGARYQTYYPGDEVRISVSFNAAVSVTGRPSVASVPYLSGSGTSTVVFGFTVPANTTTYDLTPLSIELNGGAITSAEGLEASRSLDFGNTGFVPPRIQVASVASDTRSATVGVPFSYRPAYQVTDPTFRASGLPAGLTIDARTADIAGTPTTPGTFSIQITASGLDGRPTVSGILTLTVAPAATPQPPPSPPAPTPVTLAGGAASGVLNQVFNYTVVATGAPTSFQATGLPPGLTIGNNGVITGSPTAAGTYSAKVTASNAAGSSASTTITLAIAAPAPSPKQGQILEFNSPVSALLVDQPIALAATSSANLPITYTVVSGNATLAGNQLTLRDTNPVVVRASQAGDATYNAATSVDVVFTAGKAAQAITFAALTDMTVGAAPVALTATTSSGLPISYTVTGPARIDGNTLTLTGEPGTVTVRATQAGNDAFGPALEVVRSFEVRRVGQQIYLGRMGGEPFGVGISADATNGIFVMRLAATGQILAIRFKLGPDGSLSSAIEAGRTPALAGSVRNGVFSARIAEAGIDVTATVQPAAGPTASLAGVYIASVPGSASANTYIIASATGEAFGAAPANAGSIAGLGTISNGGQVSITGAGGAIMTATVEPGTGVIRGNARVGAATASFAGLNEAAERTDRLANLSSRLNVAAGDASRSVVVGFVVSGSEAKQVLVRAVGPGLLGFNVAGAHANPRLQIYRGFSLVAENDDWSNDPQASLAGDRVGAFKLAANSRDAAVVATLAPDAYTAVVQGEGNGVVLIEVYDGSSDRPLAAQHLVNISTRGFVDTGDAQLIAGFVVTGNAPKRVLIRGLGPALAPFNVPAFVADPTLKLYAAGSATVIAQNDDWSAPQPVDATQTAATATEIALAATTAGAFPLASGSKDAAIVVTLMPGQYSVVMNGANNGIGAGVIEVYELSPR